jgi:hypothetical protein
LCGCGAALSVSVKPPAERRAGAVTVGSTAPLAALTRMAGTLSNYG